jgi:DNA-binding MarR family transcriptional regulator
MEIYIKDCWAAIQQLFDSQARLEERFANGLGSIHGLSLKDTLLLLHVAQAEGGRLSRIELAKRLSISPSTVTRTTAPLEKRGMLGRESSARDARYAYVVLTDAGRRAVTDASATLERMSAGAFTPDWTAAEVTTLTSLLGRLAHRPLGAIRPL